MVEVYTYSCFCQEFFFFFILSEPTASSSDSCYDYNTLDEYWRDVLQNRHHYYMMTPLLNGIGCIWMEKVPRCLSGVWVRWDVVEKLDCISTALIQHLRMEWWHVKSWDLIPCGHHGFPISVVLYYYGVTNNQNAVAIIISKKLLDNVVEVSRISDAPQRTCRGFARWVWVGTRWTRLQDPK